MDEQAPLHEALTAVPGTPVHVAAYPWPQAGYSSFRHFRQDERHVTRVFREHVLLFVFEGVLHFGEDGRAVSVAAGEWYLQESGRLQTGDLPSPAPVYHYIHFATQPTAPADGWQRELVLPRRGMFRTEVFRPFFMRLDALGRHSAADSLRRQGLLLELLALLSEVGARDASKPSPGACGLMGASSATTDDADSRLAGSAEQARRMLLWLERHAAEPVGLMELAARFHFSQDAVIRILRRWTGATPGQWLRRFRIEKARMLLLETDDPLPAIAEAAGYGDVSVLHRAFRAESGMTPGAWRRQARTAGMPAIR